MQDYVHYSELRQLTYNIAALQQEKRFHSLAVLSFFPAEGKTLLCAALASAYAETCRSKVLVVDTATYHNKGSLALGDCLGQSASMVDVKSLDALRKNGLSRLLLSSGTPPPMGKAPEVEPEVVQAVPPRASPPPDNDFAILKNVADQASREYGLVLMDTAPLNAKNKSNIDPLLVARLADASVLVVSRKFLEAGNMNSSLKVLQDPALHLLGLISNEAFAQ